MILEIYFAINNQKQARGHTPFGQPNGEGISSLNK